MITQSVCACTIRKAFLPYNLPVYVFLTWAVSEHMLPSYGAFLLALMVCVGVSFVEAFFCGKSASWED